ncbi:MAG: hypothetical protein ACFFC3_12405 [Candidatus Odinarchaeota archaeon]
MIVGNVTATDASHGRESKTNNIGGYHYTSIVDVQGHMVYNPSTNGGYEAYAVFFYGENEYDWTKTAIRVKMYYTVLYEQTITMTLNGQTTTWTEYRWDRPPIDLVTWDGDMDYAATTPGTWSYSVGVQGSYENYQFSFGATYTPSVTISKSPEVNPPIQDAIYRYLGTFASSYSAGEHEFKACVRLHTHNTVANIYGPGFVTNTPISTTFTKILAIRIRADFTFSYKDWLGNWVTATTHSHLMGDGVNPDNNDIDLSNIPFVEGLC